MRQGYEKIAADFRADMRKLQMELEFRKKEIEQQKDASKKKDLLKGGGFGASAAERMEDIRLAMTGEDYEEGGMQGQVPGLITTAGC